MTIFTALGNTESRTDQSASYDWPRQALMDEIIRLEKFKRIPRHIGFIPDGNRRWAELRGWPKEKGYSFGIEPGLALLDLCRRLGVEEVSIYGFTQDNVQRPRKQVEAFCRECAEFSRRAIAAGAAFMALGDVQSGVFPEELRPYAGTRSDGDFKVTLLTNYSWEWDLKVALDSARSGVAISRRNVAAHLGSAAASRIELVVRWGGRQRLSGFLPCQSAYADFFGIDTLWPDAQPEELLSALRWYQKQDVTLGG